MVFENEAYGKIRVELINGQPWFSSEDVDEAMKRAGAGKLHVSALNDSFKTRYNKMNMVSEEGLITLARNSRVFPEAREFSEWIRKTVIPKSVDESYKEVRDLGSSSEGYAVKGYASRRFGLVRGVIRENQLWLIATDVLRGLRRSGTYIIDRKIQDKDKTKVNLKREMLAKRSAFNAYVAVSMDGVEELISVCGTEETTDFCNWLKEEAIPAMLPPKKEKAGTFTIINYNENPIRTTEHNGETWFVARDIGNALHGMTGVKRINEQINKVVPERDKYKGVVGEKGQTGNLINANAVEILSHTMLKKFGTDIFSWLINNHGNTVNEADNSECTNSECIEPSAYESVQNVEESKTELPDITVDVLEWKGQPVLTTERLAEKYGCSPVALRQNFVTNKTRFIENKDYFHVVGEELQMIPGIAADTKELILWTRKGVCRHSKCLNTDKAWDVYEHLEETYFMVSDNTMKLTADSLAQLVEAAVDKALSKLQLLPSSSVYDSQWRKTTNEQAQKIAAARGLKTPQQIYTEAYIEMAKRKHVNLNKLLEAKRVHFRSIGASEKVIKKLNCLDVIGDDPAFINEYKNIMSEMYNDVCC